uniref:Uncharacterized protein n=1 Tax=Solanum tuberosum TaxID=4113 RepID=M1ANT4_SOLTU
MLQFWYIRLACHCLAYLEDTAVCLSIGNLPDAKNQSTGRVSHYIVPSISKSDKMVRGSSCNYTV